jgi:hypothetical protein
MWWSSGLGRPDRRRPRPSPEPAWPPSCSAVAAFLIGSRPFPPVSSACCLISACLREQCGRSGYHAAGKGRITGFSMSIGRNSMPCCAMRPDVSARNCAETARPAWSATAVGLSACAPAPGRRCAVAWSSMRRARAAGSAASLPCACRHCRRRSLRGGARSVASPTAWRTARPGSCRDGMAGCSLPRAAAVPPGRRRGIAAGHPIWRRSRRTVPDSLERELAHHPAGRGTRLVVGRRCCSAAGSRLGPGTCLGGCVRHRGWPHLAAYDGWLADRMHDAAATLRQRYADSRIDVTAAEPAAAASEGLR